jgi:hypothetical protein
MTRILSMLLCTVALHSTAALAAADASSTRTRLDAAKQFFTSWKEAAAKGGLPRTARVGDASLGGSLFKGGIMGVGVYRETDSHGQTHVGLMGTTGHIGNELSAKVRVGTTRYVAPAGEDSVIPKTEARVGGGVAVGIGGEAFTGHDGIALDGRAWRTKVSAASQDGTTSRGGYLVGGVMIKQDNRGAESRTLDTSKPLWSMKSLTLRRLDKGLALVAAAEQAMAANDVAGAEKKLAEAEKLSVRVQKAYTR